MAENNGYNAEIPLKNFEPREVYQRFENMLLKELPFDQPEFITLLEREGIISEKSKKKVHMPNQTKGGCAAAVLKEINTLPSFSIEKFEKLLLVMKEYDHGLEILAQKMKSYLNPVDGPFDCEAMCAYLMKNHDVLKNLPYNKMELELVADDVIPYHEKLVMESQRNDAQMCTVLNYVRTNLHHKYPKRFKSILQVMENSDDPSLKVTAKSLGGSERVPDTIEDISMAVPDFIQVSAFSKTGAKRRKPDTHDDDDDDDDPPIKVKMMQYPKISKEKPAFAIILNNKEFDVEGERKGTEKDENTIYLLREKFEGMIRFHEYTLRDLTADEINGAFKMLAQHDPNSLSETELEGALKLFGADEKASSSTEKRKFLNYKQINFNEFSCFMAFIMSHGNERGIFGKDCAKMVKIDTLSSYFTPSKCEGLINKPKIFFIQACRGSQLDRLSTMDDISFKAPTDDITPNTADFLYVYATPESYKATRNEIDGSLFIQTLVEVMQQTVGYYHLEETLLFVKNEMGTKTLKVIVKNQKNEDEIVDIKQIVSVVSQLRGRVVFAKE